ncbi:uncharacterized protein [Typha angustifolia]|uniref:uncharacterized protein n=1 Tax=Typha angustifolia TaxID=59011 RepID=UPI003C2C6617
MADSVDVVLEFLRKNRFAKAEAALRAEVNNRPDLNGVFQKNPSEAKGKRQKDIGTAGNVSGEFSREFIVKEIEVGSIGNGSESKKDFGSNSGDLYPWNFDIANNSANAVPRDSDSIAEKFAELLISEQPKHLRGSLMVEKRDSATGGESDLSVDRRVSFGRGKGKAEVEVKPYINQMSSFKANNAYSEDQFPDNLWLESEEPSKGCSVKTVLPFPSDSASGNYDCYFSYGGEMKVTKKKDEIGDVMEETKEQLDEFICPYFPGKSGENMEQKNIRNFDYQVTDENQKEEYPRLPPVRLKSQDKLVNMQLEEKVDRHGSGAKLASGENTFMIGSFLDVPVGQEINTSGGKRAVGSSWLSVSQGIAEDTSDLVSGFATVGDDSVDYPNEYWDSDEYEDDDDVGYTRQPIEDETWFLAHEIDYPSDNEKGSGHRIGPDQQDHVPTKEEGDEDEGDDHSFAEEDSFLSGDHYFQAKNINKLASSKGQVDLGMPETYGQTDENDLIAQYDGQLMDVEELNLMHAEPVWQGFVTQNNELVMLGNGKALNGSGQPQSDDPFIEDDQHGSVRSIGVGINSDAADMGSEVRESLIGGSSEGDIEYFYDQDVSISGRKNSQSDNRNYFNKSRRENTKGSKQDPGNYILAYNNGTSPSGINYPDGGFSFPPPLPTGDMPEGNSGNSLGNIAGGDDSDECGNGIVTDDMLAKWRRKSSDSSPIRSSRDEKNSDAIKSRNSTASSPSNYGYAEREDIEKLLDHKINNAQEEDPATTLEDEEVAALQEQVRQINAQEEEFETFNLKILHRKNRTGFEEDKSFHVVLNSVIAGRYHVTEYLGSAAFSKAIQAHDLHTGMDVCVKIIKNNKDFFDQSLDEIKLLKYVNKNDPADKYHILRLYDYFYYREHLLIVCELLKANLYEFHKFNRESGGEVYFTMPRLQSITIQCLEALQFLHGLGLIHCDLKPENILVKSYSRCEVKVIDLGSSCFETDHLCSYVQSRSYRAPEVILGLPYDKKIDVWSLGCILAELCTGNVLFQNDSPATLLARVIGIIGPIEQGMLAKGRDTYKYFTKNHMLYERNQETNRLEYLIPKKSSLRHRLPMGDQGFIEFVAHLLETNPKKRPSASEALKHPWLSYPYEPISS